MGIDKQDELFEHVATREKTNKRLHLLKQTNIFFDHHHCPYATAKTLHGWYPYKVVSI